MWKDDSQPFAYSICWDEINTFASKLHPSCQLCQIWHVYHLMDFQHFVFFQEWIAALDLTDIDHLAFNVLDSPLTSVYRFSCWHRFYTFNLDNSHRDHHLGHWQSISHAWRHTRYVYMHVYKHIWFINGAKHYLIGQFNLVF